MCEMVSRIDWQKYKGVLLSPGPEIPQKANFLMDYVSRVHQERIPCLGVCLGHQAINLFYGGTLKKEVPMHGKTSFICHNYQGIFRDIPSPTQVVRYHSLQIDKLAKDFEVSAKSGIGEIMAIQHNKHKMYGLQFHPESILTEFGLKMLSNWITISF